MAKMNVPHIRSWYPGDPRLHNPKVAPSPPRSPIRDHVPDVAHSLWTIHMRPVEHLPSAGTPRDVPGGIPANIDWYSAFRPVVIIPNASKRTPEKRWEKPLGTFPMTVFLGRCITHPQELASGVDDRSVRDPRVKGQGREWCEPTFANQRVHV